MQRNYIHFNFEICIRNITPYIEFNKSGDIEIIKISVMIKNKYFYLSK